MSKPTDIRIKDVHTETERIGYRSPIKFGGRVVTDAVLVNVTIDVETRSGKRGRGFGSMPMGNVWAWPSGVVTPASSCSAGHATKVSAPSARRENERIPAMASNAPVSSFMFPPDGSDGFY